MHAAILLMNVVHSKNCCSNSNGSFGLSVADMQVWGTKY